MLFLTLTLFLKHNFTNVVYYRKYHCLPSKNVHIAKQCRRGGVGA